MSKPSYYLKQAFIVLIVLLSNLMIRAQRVAPLPYTSNTNVNYVRTWDAKAPQTDDSKIRVTSSIDSFIMTTQYVDGLGRPIQTVVKQFTPLGKDLVTPVVYDEMGRQQIGYLPFTANNTGGNTSLTDGMFKLNPYQQDSTFSEAQYPGENYFYSQVNFESSPLSRPLENFAPGDSWVGTSGQSQASNRRSVKMDYLFNTVSDSVRIWNTTANVVSAPTCSTSYAAGQLYKTVTADEHQNKVIEYKDKEGNVVLKKVQLDANPGSAHIGWLCTYYVYDNLGNLRFVIQPRAIEYLLAAGNWTISNPIRDELCFYYGYDGRGRMIVKKVPGAGELYMVYDKRDRLVMTQDSLLRVAQKWMVTLYDDLNRPVQTGLVNNSSIGTKSFSSHRTDASASSAYPFNQWNLPGSGYELLTHTGYDYYDSIPSGGPNGNLASTYINSANFYTSYNTAPVFAQAITKSNQTRGAATWTKVKVLETTSTFLYSTTIYDERARVIQVKSTNVSGGVDTITNQYDFAGKLLRNHIAHYKAGTNAQRYYVLSKNAYDPGGRMTSISKRENRDNSNNTTDKVISEMSYNELGQLKQKQLAPAFNSNAGLESMVFDYNIRGWLLGANRTYAKSTTSASNYFGFDLGYDKTSLESLGNYVSGQYNGNIGGMVWKSTGDDQVRKYDFTYDAVNRLTGADFNQYTSSSFNKTGGLDFSVKNLTYDANGNILTMDQRGWKITGSTTIDSMKYHYYSYSNKLMNVIDKVNEENTRLGDFRASQLYMTALSNNKTSGATDYIYDGNGNMVKDKNKDIENYTGANGIEYNHLNLPKKITMKSSTNTNKGTIEYVYDAGGNKLKKITTEGTKITTTLYLFGNYVNDTLQYLPQEEGRIRFRQDSNDFSYDYFLKDHLGNVRMVLTDEEKVDMYPAATMEDEYLQDEILLFARVEETRDDNIPIDYPTDEYTDPNEFIAKVIAEEKMIGPAITLKVMAGDKINIRVSSWYQMGQSSPSANYDILLEDLINVFSGQSVLLGNKATDNDLNFNSGRLNNDVDDYLRSISGEFETQNKPWASLNWILFDEQFKMVSSSSGFDAVGDDEEFKIHILQNLLMEKSGYLFVFVANSDEVIPVYFDNLQVTHVRGPILEETHYYPFGLTMFGISYMGPETGSLGNKKLYNNGSELQHKEFYDGSGLEIYETMFRSYDPQIGRFFQMDLLSCLDPHLSSYLYSSNNPVLRNDPMGLKDTIVNGEHALANVNMEPVIVKTAPKLKGGKFNGKSFNEIATWYKTGIGSTSSQKKSKFSNEEIIKRLENGELSLQKIAKWQNRLGTLAGGVTLYSMKDIAQYVKLIRSGKIPISFLFAIAGTAMLYESNKTHESSKELAKIAFAYVQLHSTTSTPNPTQAKGVYEITYFSVTGGTGGAGGYYSTSYYDIATKQFLGEIHGGF